MLRLVIWPSMMLLGWTETKLWTLKYGSKSTQTSLILRQRPPKPYKLLKFFISFVTTVISRHALTIWKKLRWKSLCLPILKSITEIMKNFKSLYGFGGSCLKIRDVCMDFEPYFKVHNLVSVHPKSNILCQMINLDMIFYVVVSVYQLVKIWNSPQFPVEFWNGLYECNLQPLKVYTKTVPMINRAFRRWSKPIRSYLNTFGDITRKLSNSFEAHPKISEY